jgi:hypothetical protein
MIVLFVYSSSNIGGRLASALVSSLREMPVGKNLKTLIEQQHRLFPRLASDKRLPPPAERVFVRLLYFLNPERTKYVILVFYPERGHQALFKLGGVR